MAQKKRQTKLDEGWGWSDPQNEKKRKQKLDKYLKLTRELKNLWNMKVTLIPIVDDALKTVTNAW